MTKKHDTSPSEIASSGSSAWWQDPRFLLCGICIITLILLLIKKQFAPLLPNDSFTYIAYLKTWQGSPSFADFIAENPNFRLTLPMYFFICHGVAEIVGNVELACTIISFTCAISLPVVMYALVHDLGGSEKLSLLSAILLTWNPPVLSLGCVFLRDLPFLCFVLSSFALAAGALLKGKRSAVLSGIFLAMQLLTRSEGAEVLLLYVAFLLFLYKWKNVNRKIFWQKSLLIGLGFLLPFVLLLLLSGIRAQVYFSELWGYFSFNLHKFL